VYLMITECSVDACIDWSLVFNCPFSCI